MEDSYNLTEEDFTEDSYIVPTEEKVPAKCSPCVIVLAVFALVIFAAGIACLCIFLPMIFDKGNDYDITSPLFDDIINGEYSKQFTSNFTFVNDSPQNFIFLQNSLIQFGEIEADNSIVISNYSIPTYFIYSSTPQQVSYFEVDDSGSFLLLFTNKTKRYRHSGYYNLFITPSPVSSESNENSYLRITSKSVTNASFIQIDNALVVMYVANNNVFARTIAIDGVILTNDTIGTELQITDSGSDVIFNGVADWLMEEEILSQTSTLFAQPAPSNKSPPDALSSSLCASGGCFVFLTLDDTDVIEYSWDTYSIADSYPVQVSIPYPKAGSFIPSFTINLGHLSLDEDGTTLVLLSGTISTPTPNVSESEQFTYVSRVIWGTGGELYIRFMSREQRIDGLYVSILGTNLLKTEITNDLYEVYTQEVSEAYWIPIHNSLTPLDALNNTFRTLDLVYPSSAEFEAVVLYSLPIPSDSEPTTTSLTVVDQHSNFGIVQIIGVQQDGTVLVMDTRNDSSERSLSYTTIDGISASVECTPSFLSSSFISTPLLSSDASYLYIRNEGPNLPFDSVMIRDNITGVWTLVDYLVVNSTFGDKMSAISKPSIQYVSIPASPSTIAPSHVSDTATSATRAMIWYPPFFSEKVEDGVKFPCVIYQYSGPRSQKVTKKYPSIDWLYYMAINGTVIVTIDVAGTGFRGRSYESQVRLRLGEQESSDVVTAAEWISLQEWSGKLAVYGWSYGGFVSGMSAINASVNTSDESLPVFSAAISVAPVTDWKWYDAAYTERYMSLPNLNETGYNVASVVRSCSELDGKNIKYLLIHGSADDNYRISSSSPGASGSSQGSDNEEQQEDRVHIVFTCLSEGSVPKEWVKLLPQPPVVGQGDTSVPFHVPVLSPASFIIHPLGLPGNTEKYGKALYKAALEFQKERKELYEAEKKKKEEEYKKYSFKPDIIVCECTRGRKPSAVFDKLYQSALEVRAEQEQTRKEAEEKRLASYSFRPNLETSKKSEKGQSQKKRQVSKIARRVEIKRQRMREKKLGVFSALYDDATRRHMRQAEYHYWFPEDYTFHPDLSKSFSTNSRYKPSKKVASTPPSELRRREMVDRASIPRSLDDAFDGREMTKSELLGSKGGPSSGKKKSNRTEGIEDLMSPELHDQGRISSRRHPKTQPLPRPSSYISSSIGTIGSMSGSQGPVSRSRGIGGPVESSTNTGLSLSSSTKPRRQSALSSSYAKTSSDSSSPYIVTPANLTSSYHDPTSCLLAYEKDSETMGGSIFDMLDDDKDGILYEDDVKNKMTKLSFPDDKTKEKEKAVSILSETKYPLLRPQFLKELSKK
ncbi:hypothetical protein ADUPG1_007011 [Aduncisulcus paluster]|uniref:EF-hand domain-containing protein n=1 Tax=Aduncisulcus paluster TaxID=2918883 RepID=A0ABQ5KND5_9EUKA|nr:hypothetical protein ADUPG1_007011 [Aduncisulcus paluster]